MGRQTPEHFLKSIQLLIDSKSIDPFDLKIQFVGHYDAPIRAMLKRYSKRIPIEILNFQPYDKTLRHQAESDVLLLIVSIDEEEQGQQTMTGKFFEYIGARQPLFALVPEGPLKRLIRKGKFGTVAPPKDVSQIANHFLAIYQQWKKTGIVTYTPDLSLRNKFSRKYLTEQLADVVRNVMLENAESFS